MNEKLISIIATCVGKNIHFTGSVGTLYTIQDLLHVVSLRSIDLLWKLNKKQLAELDSDSLYTNSSTSKVKEKQFMLDALAEVFAYKQSELERVQLATKVAEEKAARLAVLKQIKTTKEFEALGELNIDQIEAEIALASK